MIKKIAGISFLPFVAAICVSCGGDSASDLISDLEDQVDFGDDSASGRVGVCIVSAGTADDLIGVWDLAAIQGVSESVSINGPLEFFGSGTYNFTAQVDTPDYFINYQNQVGSYSFTDSSNTLATTGAFSTIFSTEITIEFCNGNSQFTFLDTATDGRRHTYVKQ